MKKKILSFVLAFCLIVPAICMFSACGEKLYDIEITTNTSIDHIQEIKFASSSTKTTTYRNSEDTYIEVICDQGYAPDLVFTVGSLQISEYSDYFGDIFHEEENPDYDENYQPGIDEDDGVNRTDQYITVYTGVRYTYTIPTKDLTGKQAITYSGDTKPAKIRLTFNLDKGGDDVNFLDGDYEGLSFEFKGLADNQTRTFTALAFIEFANANHYLMLDYEKPAIITLKSNHDISNYSACRIFYVQDRYNCGEDWNVNSYTWTVKSDINFELMLTLECLKEVILQEVVE